MAIPTEDPHNPHSATLTAATLTELIMAAVEAINDPNGLNMLAITNYIEQIHGGLQKVDSAMLAHKLDELRQNGQLVFVNDTYKKPAPVANAPEKRGRGRPPKPKAHVPSGTIISPPRPRGRPPKPRDPFAVPPAPKDKPLPESGKPRGRPPKKVKTTTESAPVIASAPVTASAVTGAPRGRGRPPKVKPAVAPVGC